jgi:hypothetical protein
MNLQKLNLAFELLKERKTSLECDFHGPKDENIIFKAELILGLKFPPSYRFFLQTVGAGGPGKAYIPGLITNTSQALKDGGIVWGELTDREKGFHPKHLINIHDVGEGTTYCLDTSQMNEEGECPVVAWPLGGYEETPVLEIIAPDFGTFFLDLVKQELNIP